MQSPSVQIESGMGMNRFSVEVFATNEEARSGVEPL